MRKSEVPIIWFDWVHRSWKGTQLDLLELMLKKDWYFPLIAKGHWTRKWLWENKYSDPKSDWRQEKYISLKNGSNQSDWEDAAEKLNQELYDLLDKEIPRLINEGGSPVLLLDRTILSRDFVNLQYVDGIDDMSIEDFYNTWNYISSITNDNIIVPDIIFALQAETSVLLNRFTGEELETTQWKFREKNIKNGNPLFNKMLDNLISPYQKNVIILKALNDEHNLYRIHNTIKKYLIENNIIGY